MSNGFLNTTQLDFAAYKDALKQYLQQQDIFKDYDFEGSNISVLLDLLAYNTYMNGTYLNMVGSEMFLDTALLRESIVSHAKELNYTPRSRTSAEAEVDLVINVGNNAPDSITIPKYYRVTGRASDGTRYNFVTREPFVVSSANNYTANAISLFQGNIVNETYVANSSTRYILQSANVDVNSIEVNIQTSSANTANTNWLRATTLFGANPDSQVFFVQGAEDFKYEVVFGNGIVGQQLVDGNIVRIAYRETAGDDANGIRTFTAEQAIQGFGDIAVTLTDASAPAFGGSEHETNAEIKFNAPRFFSTQERAVTTNDFIILLKSQFAFLEAITAYGGELADPKQYGKVIISAKPFGSEILSDKTKTEILKFIRDKSAISIDPVITDPNYFYVGVTSQVSYNLNRTTKTSSDIATLVRNRILSYSSERLSDFGSDLRFSNLIATIDAADSAIVSNNTRATLIKRLIPTIAVTETFAIDFGNPLIVNEFDISLTSVTPAISSTAFTFRLNEINYNAFLQDNGLGGLFIYTVENSQKVILAENVGTVNYETGRVVIGSLTTRGFDGTSLKIIAMVRNSDIETTNNKILLIDDADVSVTANGIRI